MKRFFVVLSFIFISHVLSFSQTNLEFVGQNEGVISLQCELDQYHVSNNGIYTAIHVQEGTPILKAGAPGVEKLSTAVIVDDHAMMQVHITNAEYQEFNDVYILPSKGNINRIVDPETIPYFEGNAYQHDEFYPSDLASLDEPFIQNQFRAQTVHFYPVQYNPISHVLRVYSNIEVDIVPSDEVGENPLPANVSGTTNATLREVYANRFINYTANASRYDVVSELGNILVIAQAQYFEELQPWIQWKKEKGFPTELVDVATINSIASITSFVEDYYNTNGLTYLVFVGDEDQVPVPLVNNSGGQGYCDPCYGYISGNDNYSEVLIGRLLVHTDDELIPVIDKILEYEKNPDVSVDWFSVAMGLGSNEGTGIGDDNEADWQHNNNIKIDLLDYTYTKVWEKYDGSHAGDSPSGGVTADGSGSPSATSLTTVINDGCSLINYTGHGAHNLIVTGSYSNTQINALNNKGFYPYFIIVGCCTGDYDDDDASGDTFGEAWIKSPSASNTTGGIGGAFSSVYQSWAPPMEGQDEMNKIITEMAGYNTRHTLGSIHYNGCASMNDEYGADGDEMTDTWILMADPTVQLRTAMPVQILATHITSAFFGISELTVSCSIEDAMVGLTFNGEILATGFITGGQVILSFTSVTEPGSLLVTVTSFNTIPYQGYVELVPADGPFITGNVTGITDLNGNGNGLADYNESIHIDANANNIGIETAMDVSATITCSNSFVIIDDNSQTYGDITASSFADGTDAFSFHIDGYIQDQTVLVFVIHYSDANGNTWTSNYNLVINAPVLSCVGSFDVNDFTGNYNGRLDSGESVTLSIPITNSGHASTAVAVLATLTDNSSFTNIQVSNIDLGIVAPGQTVNALFTVSVDASTPSSENVNFDFSSTSDFYDSACNDEKTMNQIVEDWETGSDNSFPWAYEDDADWFVTNQIFFEGDYSMQSGDIANSQQTTLVVDLNFDEAGVVSFMHKTSTEANYDFLKFKIGAAQQGSWSGESEWTSSSYNISAGQHTLRWIYDKDNVASSGSDAVWVDNIVLPQGTLIGVREEVTYSDQLSVYPNPANEMTVVTFMNAQTTTATLSVQNMVGEMVFSLQKNAITKGMNQFKLDTSAWASGVYLISLKTATEVFTEKIIKE